MSRRPAYEPDRVDVRRLGWVGVVFVVALALVLGLMYLLWNRTPPFPVPAAAVPPPPRLQGDPRRDLIAVQQAQQRRLQSWGWDDPQHRYAHIPVARAMAMLATASSTASTEQQP
jgi:hypothetical protein